MTKTLFSKTQQSTKHAFRWPDAIWCSVLALYVLAGVSLVPLHGDEPTQIFMGRDFYYHMQGQGEEIRFAEWDTLTGEQATEQDLRLINGTLPKYLFGMVAYMSGYAFEDINQQWAWGSGWEWNHTNGHVPTDDLLLRTRYISGVLLAISAIALFSVGYMLAGRFVAYVASAYFVLNPAVLVNGRRAMMEGGLLAFSILVVLVALWLVQNRGWWVYVLLGLLSGLAVASKHTAVVTVIAVFLSCGSLFLWQILRYDGKDATRWQDLGALFSAGILSLCVFFALNPAWWGTPADALMGTIDRRANLLQGQTDFFGRYETWQAQAAGFWEQAFIVQPAIVDSDFDGFESQQVDAIRAYEQSWLSGFSIGGNMLGAVLMLGLVSIGIIRLVTSIQPQRSWIIGLWTLATLILTLVLTPIDWQRYYLPLYPVIAILGAIGLDFIFKLVWQLVGQAKTIDENTSQTFFASTD
ncbi:MAG: phospholipid carrier-dependent glycosyltransferase [Chloroflexota bacterium]